MVAAVVPFVAGIIVFDRYELWGALFWAMLVVGCCVSAICLRGRMAEISIFFALFLFGGAVLSLHGDVAAVSDGQAAVVDMEVADVPSVRENGFVSAPVRIAGGKAVVWSDGSFPIAFGDRIRAVASLRGFDSSEGDSQYEKLMRRRGFAGGFFITAADTLAVVHGAGRTSLHAIAAERFARLDLSPAARGAAAAMGVGDRSRLTPQLREAYARSGVSHILAVSGLHIGIIYLLASTLFCLLSFFRYGHIVRYVLVLIPVWLYAAVCGFSPATVRAAVMFTMLQIAMIRSSAYSSPNILAATAFLILTFDPYSLFDISFQLSFTAVAAIVTAGVPLFSFARTRTVAGRFLWNTFVIGVVAFIATAPLISHHFGKLSLAGIIVNPTVIVCAYIIIMMSALWIAAPLPLLQPAVSAVLEFVTGVQNSIVGKIASYEWLNVDVRLSGAATIAVYAVFIMIATVWLSRDEARRS